MQEQGKQPEPVEREKSFQQRERERIADEYDRINRKGIYAETEDVESEEYLLDPAEKAQLYAERLKGGVSFQERSQAAREAIYAKHSAPEEEISPYDDQPDPDEVLADFRARHPEITDADWKILDDRAFHAKAPDVWQMQQNLKHSATRAEMDLLLERALDGLEAYKLERDRRAAFQKVAQSRFKTRGM